MSLSPNWQMSKIFESALTVFLTSAKTLDEIDPAILYFSTTSELLIE